MEVVVFVLMLSVIGAVAAPRTNQVSESDERQTRQTLAVVRNAIRIYHHTTNEYPPIGTKDEFSKAMSPYLSAIIPNPSALPGKSATVIAADSNQVDDSSLANSDAGWIYDRKSGSFKLNTNDSEKSGW